MISLRDVVTGFGNRDPLAEVWRRSLHGGGGGSAVITGVPPLRYIGNGRPLTDYLISGNTVQDGTPTPENPVPVVGCGTDTAGEWTFPLTVNDTEYPIYLGTVPTMRRIKKLVLTGEENWQLVNRIESVGGQYFNRSIGTQERTEFGKMLCSHYIVANPYDRLTACCVLANYSQGIDVRVNNPSTESNIDNFKAYLAAQYAAGTPVTVWYVLETPKTAVVNEPLMKIGDYADTVSAEQAGVTIPTVSGANVLDVPTEVPPSEIAIKGGIRSV